MKNNIIKQQKYFDDEKNQYVSSDIENPPLHTKLELSIISQKLHELNINSKIMDFGSGTGRISVFLLQKRFSVYAVDVSNDSLKKLQETAKKLSFSNLKVSKDIPNKKFQAIVGADILHHIELDKYLPKIYKSLKKDGIVIFSEPGGMNLSWYIYLPLFQNWKIEKGVTTCTYNNLIKKFKKNGFREILIKGLGLLPRPLFKWSEKLCRLNDRIGDIPFFRRFAYRYIIEAKK